MFGRPPPPFAFAHVPAASSPHAPPRPELIFVYNANPGLAAGFVDAVHKIVSPATYPCSLCAVTYGALRMDPRWRDWLRAAPAEVSFCYRPGFRAAHPEVNEPLPAVFVQGGGDLTPLVRAAELNALPDLDALIALIEARLAPLPGR